MIYNFINNIIIELKITSLCIFNNAIKKVNLK